METKTMTMMAAAGGYLSSKGLKLLDSGGTPSEYVAVNMSLRMVAGYESGRSSAASPRRAGRVPTKTRSAEFAEGQTLVIRSE